jgi:monoamine oxidase
LNTIAGRNVQNDVGIVDFMVPFYYEYENGKFYSYKGSNELDYKWIDSTWFDFFNDFIAPSIMDDIQFNCAVNAIDYRTTNIKVTCGGGATYSARKVVVTVPLPVLKAGNIRFLPALPTDKTSALSKVSMSPGIKVFLKFSQKFYYNDFGYAKDANANDNERYFYDATYGQTTNEYILGLFAVGTPAREYTSKSDAQIVTAVLNELNALYGNNVATQSYTGKAVVQNWSNEAHVRGAYSNYYGNYNQLRKLARPLGDKIFFAGEAFPVDWENGFVHTAAISGKAAAYQIVNGVKTATFLCNLYDGIDC